MGVSRLGGVASGPHTLRRRMSDLHLLRGTWGRSWSPLHFAAFENNLEEALSHCTPDLINKPDRVGRSPLQIAIENGSLQVIAEMVKNGALIEKVEINGRKGVELFEHQHYFDLGIELLPIINGMTDVFLLRAACHAGFTNRPDIMSDVINNSSGTAGSSVLNGHDCLGLTPIHYAVLGNSTECVELVCANTDNRAIRYISSTDLASPFHYACSKGYNDVFHSLHSHLPVADDSNTMLSNQDVSGRTPFHQAIFNSHWDLLVSCSSLLGTVNPYVSDCDGHSLPGLMFLMRFHNSIPAYIQTSLPCLSQDESNWLLHLAISDANHELVEHSLQQNADPNCFDLMGQTPLIYAAKLGLSEPCSLLLKHGADQSIKDFTGHTALHYASANGHSDTVTTLLLHEGADCLSLSCDVRTPLDLAFLNGHIDIANDLIKAIDRTKSSQALPYWVTTLNMAVTCASKSTLQSMVQCMPSSWMKELLFVNATGKHKESTPPLTTAHREHNRQYSMLRQYVPYPRAMELTFKDLRRPSKARGKLEQQIKEVKKHKSFVSVFKNYPRNKKYESFFTVHSHETHYPIHQALYARNEDAFTFLLTEARDIGLLREFLALIGPSKVGVAQLLLEIFPELMMKCDIEEDVYQCLLRVFAGEREMPFPLALLHYIVSDSSSPLVYKQNISYSPLHKWPKWFLENRLERYCRSLEINFTSHTLLEGSDVIQLVEAVLRSNDPCLNSNGIVTVLYAGVSNGIHPDLFEAIVRNISTLDLSFSTPNNKWPLLEAIQRGYYDIARLLLQYGDLHSSCENYDCDENDDSVPGYLMESAAPIHGPIILHHGSKNIKERLMGCFTHISAAHEFNFGLELLKQIPNNWLIDFLHTHRSRILLYRCLLDDRGADLGTFLINSFVQGITDYICNNINPEPTTYNDDDDDQSESDDDSCDDVDESFCISFCDFEYIPSFINMAASKNSSSWFQANESLGLLNSFVKFGRYLQYNNHPYLHGLCGCGKTTLLKAILQNSKFQSSSLLKGFGSTPLFNAAASGHVKGLRLIMSYFPSIMREQSPDKLLSTALGGLFHLCYGTYKYGNFKTVFNYFEDNCIPLYIKTWMSRELRQPDSDTGLTGEFLRMCFDGFSHTSLTEKSSDLLTLFLFRVPKLFTIAHDLGDFIAELQLALDHRVRQREGVGVVWQSKRSCPSSSTQSPEWFGSMSWNISGGKNISDWIFRDLAHLNGDTPCPDSLLHLLETFLCIHPPFNPLEVVRSGYYKLLKEPIGHIEQVIGNHGNYSSIIGEWQDAVMDIIRRCEPGDQLCINMLRGLNAISEFRDIFDLRKLLLVTVTYKGNFNVNLLEYLLEFEQAKEFITATVTHAAQRGNIEAVKVLIPQNESLFEANFTSILIAAAKSGQTEVIEYFNQYSLHVVMNSTQYFNQDTKFWLVVFKSAVHSGKEALAMKAINMASFDAVMTMASSVEVVHDACWWGMAGVLSALCIDNRQIYFETTPTSSLSPFQAALDSGHIGIVSSVDSFPSLDDFFSSDFAKSLSDALPEISLLSRFSHGWLKTLASSRRDSTACSEHLSLPHLSSNMYSNLPCNILPFVMALATPKGDEIVKSYFTRWGEKASGVVLHHMLKQYSVNPLHLAVCGGNEESVLAVLVPLANTTVHDDFMTLEIFRVALLNNNTRIVQLLTKYCNSNTLAQLCSPQGGESILHMVAQYTRSSECADLMLAMLNTHISKLVHVVDYAKMGPLECAIACGRGYVAQNLVDRTGAVTSEHIKELLLRGFGWFSNLMEANAKLTSDTISGTGCHVDTSQTAHSPAPPSWQTSPALFVLQSSLSLRNKSLTVYYDGIKNLHPCVAEALTGASCGILPLYSINAVDSSEGRYPLMVSKLLDRAKLIEFFKSGEILCRWSRRGQWQSIVNIIKYTLSTSDDDLLDSETVASIFTQACSLGSLLFVEFAMNDLYPSMVPEDAVIEGFAEAAGSGQLEVMAYLVLNSGLPQRVFKERTKIFKVSAVVNLIFFASASEIFSTLQSVKLKNESFRLLTSQMWLTHEWGEYQLELVAKRISSVFTYPDQLDISVHKHRQLSINMPGFPDSFDDVVCPFAKLAVIFSTSVSQFVPVYGQPSFHTPTNLHQPSSDGNIILSCIHGIRADESGCLYNDDSEILLTLSYDDQSGLFHWPLSHEGSSDSNDINDPANIPSSAQLFTIPYQEVFQMASSACLRNARDLPIPVRVVTDQIVIEQVIGSIASFSNILTRCVDDVLKVLKLHQYNTHLYSLYTELGLVPCEFIEAYRRFRGRFKTTSLLKDLISRVSINFELGYKSEVTCTLDSKNTLNVIYHYVIQSDPTSYDTYDCPSESETVRAIGPVLVQCEIKKFSSKLSTYLEGLPLSISVNSYNIESDTMADLTRPSQLALNDVIILRFLPLIRGYLKLLIRTLQSCLDSPHGTLDTILSDGIKILFRTDTRSASHYDRPRQCLSLNVLDTLHHRRNQATVAVLKDFIEFTRIPGLSVHKPVAVASAIEISRNMGMITKDAQGHAVTRDLTGREIGTMELNKQQIDSFAVVSAQINSVHVTNSPLKYNTAISNTSHDQFTFDINESIHLIISHPGGGCPLYTKPSIVMNSNYWSIREELDLDDAKREPLKEHDYTHYIGRKYGKRTSSPQYLTSTQILLYSKVGNTDPGYRTLSCTAVPMSEGVYEVVIKSKSRFCGAVIVLCLRCQCAMNIHSSDGRFSYSRDIIFKT